MSHQLQANLRAHVDFLAERIGERNVFLPGTLDASADYIAGRWSDVGLEVVRQAYDVHGSRCENLEATVDGPPGSRLILVGAHYDSVIGSPGANDNGSGVAALLELSRLFAEKPLATTLRFVAFANEEPPFFPGRQMGSAVYARAARNRGEEIEIMLCLETIGYYTNERGSQRYPPLLKLFYPDRGEFIAFVTKLRYRNTLKNLVRAFKSATDFPIESAATFAGIPGVGWSDHRWFWRYGYPGVMITDTALYRYPYYHTRRDTPDKLNYDELARLVLGLEGMMRYYSQ